MSLSQERPVNPAKQRLNIKSGKVTYYDKESQTNQEMSVPFSFVVLDQLASIRGWSDADNSGYWSNEVRKVGSDEVTVRTSKGAKATGVWRDIKGDSNVAGAKFTSSIYIAVKSDEGMEIMNLGLSGAALNAWIEFNNKGSLSNSTVVIDSWEDAKKGSVSYKVPVFKKEELTAADKAAAVELDKELQAYLSEYLGGKAQDEKVRSDVDSGVDIDDSPIDLSEIPF